MELGYWRRNNDELDFIVDLGSSKIGVEVKYRNQVTDKDLNKAIQLSELTGCDTCVVVTKEALAQERIDRLKEKSLLPFGVVPLSAFLKLF